MGFSSSLTVTSALQHTTQKSRKCSSHKSKLTNPKKADTDAYGSNPLILLSAVFLLRLLHFHPKQQIFYLSISYFVFILFYLVAFSFFLVNFVVHILSYVTYVFVFVLICVSNSLCWLVLFRMFGSGCFAFDFGDLWLGLFKCLGICFLFLFFVSFFFFPVGEGTDFNGDFFVGFLLFHGIDGPSNFFFSNFFFKMSIYDLHLFIASSFSLFAVCERCNFPFGVEFPCLLTPNLLLFLFIFYQKERNSKFTFDNDKCSLLQEKKRFFY